MASESRILLLENDEFDAAVIRELLEKCAEQKFAVSRFRTVCAARKALAHETFIAALINLKASDSAGIETLREILHISPQTPIIVLSSLPDHSVALAALEAGAQDFLPKDGLDSRSLERAVRFAIARKQKENDLIAKAFYDALTGLGNRALLYERWRRARSRAIHDGRHIGLLVIDVDRFKSVNDGHGHEAGDRLLVHISRRLQRSVRETDAVARLGGDEFVILLENVRCLKDLDAVRRKLGHPDRFRPHEKDKALEYTLSVGGALIDAEICEDLMTALRAADQAMYAVKEARRSASKGTAAGDSASAPAGKSIAAAA